MTPFDRRPPISTYNFYDPLLPLTKQSDRELKYVPPQKRDSEENSPAATSLVVSIATDSFQSMRGASHRTRKKYDFQISSASRKKAERWFQKRQNEHLSLLRGGGRSLS